MVALVVSLALTGCGHDGPVDAKRARAGLTIGLAVNLRDGSLDYRRSIVPLARRAGASVVRDDFAWEDVEPRRGARLDWRGPDRSAELAAAAGLRVLPLLSRAPRWATGRVRRSYDVMPREPDDYARFVAAAVARYGPGGAFWRRHPELDARLAPRWFELFNEPYGLPAEEGGPEVAAYARTAVAAVAAGRRANPRARFLIAGETTAIGAGGRETPWLDGLYDAVPGFERFVDGVAAHAYAGGRSPLRWTPGDGERYQTRRVERMHATMRRRGNGDRPIWITEIGWSTCPSSDECVTPRAQATYLSELFALASDRWPWVQGIVVFSLADFGTDPGDKEGWFGLVRDGRAKPSWSVYQRVAGAAPAAP